MNLEEVARRAQVSTATVSRVLNNKSVVRDATRERVMNAVAELNYQPNLHARMLAAGRSETIGVLVSNMQNPFFFDIVQQIENRAHQQSLEVLVANTNYSTEQLLKSIRLMAGRRVAGIAAIVSEIEPEILTELHQANCPVVLYDVGEAGENIAGKVRVDYRHGMHKLVQHLFQLGHTRRIAWIGHHMEIGPLAERRLALLEAYRNLGVDLDVQTFLGDDNLDGGWRTAREMLDSGFRPTAVVCANDFMATGVLRALREHGLSVPGDVSVTGFDDIMLAQYCFPPLTTVRVPRQQVGELLFDRLNNADSADAETLIAPELVVRESTGQAQV